MQDTSYSLKSLFGNKKNKRYYIEGILEILENNKDDRISLIRNEEVLRWIFEDLSFISEDEKDKKRLEDEWGRSVLKSRRPDLKLDKQWTNKFGEHIMEEVFLLLGKKISSPMKKEHFKPDMEVEDAIIEIKTQTYFTTGTAGEKILGCPFKYADVPELYNKPLKIICIGGAEKQSRENYGNLRGEIDSKNKKKFLIFFKENNIEFIGLTDILKGIVNKI
jgi:hypothetical protein